MYGLLPPGNEPLIPYAIRMMNAASRNEDGRALRLADDFRGTFHGPNCNPYFVGVWDTVSSVGWIENPLKLRFTADNPDIAIGRHAVSIDERRAFFRPNLWRPSPQLPDHGPKDIQQVWFPGVHCDVGGGYPEAESGLSKYALEWMAREAAKAGLLIDRARLTEVMGKTGQAYAKADPDAKLHNSLTTPWWPAELVPKKHWNWEKSQEERRMNIARHRTLPKVPLVHAVAFARKGYNVPDGATKVQTDPW
jgi:uncharacterized protein (DUF2235 family)